VHFFTHCSYFLSLLKLCFKRTTWVFLDASKAQTIYKHQLYHHLIHVSLLCGSQPLAGEFWCQLIGRRYHTSIKELEYFVVYNVILWWLVLFNIVNRMEIEVKTNSSNFLCKEIRMVKFPTTLPVKTTSSTDVYYCGFCMFTRIQLTMHGPFLSLILVI